MGVHPSRKWTLRDLFLTLVLVMTVLAILWPGARVEEMHPRDDASNATQPVAPPPVPAPAPAPPVAPPPPGPPGRGDGLPAPIPEETLMGASLHHGRVVDEERRPLGDAPVRVFVGGKLVATPRTGADGGFTVPDIPWKYRRRAHLAIALVVRDGAGRAVRASARVTMGADTDEESEAMLPHLMVGNLVLREASPVEVRVRAEGRAVEGAEVHAEERSASAAATEVVRTDAAGVARLEDLPHGEWTVFARKPGLGAGQAVVEVPSPEGLAIDLDARTLEIEAVDAATGRPLEGVHFAVRTKYRHLDEERWHHPFPPLDPPPTDSSGRTRLADAGEAAIRLLPILPGRDGPDAGAVPADVEPGATFVRVPVAGTRTVRWPLLPGEAGTPPEGSRLVVGEERFARDPQFRFTQDESRRERIENGEVAIDGLGPGPFEALARAPDGSLARLSVEAGAAKGPPVRFFAPRRLTVVVRDEDGLPVAEPVALLTPRGDGGIL